MKCMSLFIKDDKLLKKYKNIWNEVSNGIKKEFDTEPVCNGKYPRTKVNSYDGGKQSRFS